MIRTLNVATAVVVSSSFGFILSGCISAAPAKKDPTASTTGSGAKAGAGGSGGKSHPGGGSGNAGTGASGAGNGGSTAGGSGGSGGTTSDADVVKTPAPVLDSASAHVVGRNGDDVAITVTGTDADANVVMLSARFSDSSDSPVSVFDTNWDGVPDSAENLVFFDKGLLGEVNFTGNVTLAGFATTFPSATRAVVHLEDADGNVSADQTIDVAPQAQVNGGDSCDPTLVENRCPTGMACIGMPATCVAGNGPPAVTALTYVPGPNGPRLLATGTDPADDITTLRLAFETSTGTPVLVDLNGDQVPDVSTFDLDVSGSSSNGTFFVSDQLGVSFNESAPQILVTPENAAGASGPTKNVFFGDPPEGSSGSKCDPRGFLSCVVGLACSPGLLTAAQNSCVTVSKLQANACSTAPALDPAKNRLTAYGRAEGVSLWDPPAGCGQTSAVARPEGVVRLHLGASVSHLTITTALPETNFDTVLYLLPACAPAATTSTPCNDDTDGYSSTISADSVAAGDYLIVVDSSQAVGGGFGVSVTLN